MSGRCDAASKGAAGLKTWTPGSQRIWSEAARLAARAGEENSNPTCESPAPWPVPSINSASHDITKRRVSVSAPPGQRPKPIHQHGPSTWHGAWFIKHLCNQRQPRAGFPGPRTFLSCEGMCRRARHGRGYKTGRLRRAIWQHLPNFTTHVPFDPVLPLLGKLPYRCARTRASVRATHGQRQRPPSAGGLHKPWVTRITKYDAAGKKDVGTNEGPAWRRLGQVG